MSFGFQTFELTHQLIIRADGDAKTGLGHLYRTLALADMLETDYVISYICKQAPETFLDELKKRGFSWRITPDEASWISKLTAQTTVIMDGYHFDIGMQSEIRRKGAKLALIDDIHDRPLEADILINHAPGVRPADYAGMQIGRFALGTEYALLRPAFIEAAQAERTPANAISTVLVAFGGADPLGLSMLAVQYLLRDETLKVIVVLGSANNQVDAFMQLHEKVGKRLKLMVNAGEDAMQKAMHEADFGVVSSSSTLFECMACKLPVMSGYYVSNQRNIHDGLKAEGCFLDAGDYREAGWLDLLATIHQADRNKMIREQSRMIDGLSPKRFRILFNEITA